MGDVAKIQGKPIETVHDCSYLPNRKKEQTRCEKEMASAFNLYSKGNRYEGCSINRLKGMTDADTIQMFLYCWRK